MLKIFYFTPLFNKIKYLEILYENEKNEKRYSNYLKYSTYLNVILYKHRRNPDIP